MGGDRRRRRSRWGGSSGGAGFQSCRIPDLVSGSILSEDLEVDNDEDPGTVLDQRLRPRHGDGIALLVLDLLGVVVAELDEAALLEFAARDEVV